MAEVDERGHQHEGEQRQLPRQHEHGRHRHPGERELEEEHREGSGHHGLHAADVVRDAGLDLPRAGGREEAKGHALKVLVEPLAEVVHHALTDGARVVGLDHGEQSRQEAEHDHGGHQHRQKAGPRRAVRGEQRFVEDDLGEQRGRRLKRRRHQDEEPQQRDMAPVGPEEAHDAAQRRARRGALS
jgi:hypothetical protein